MLNEDIAERVRKLLALSRSPNEHEAALAASRARDILAKHHLSIEDLDDALGKEEFRIISRVIAEEEKNEKWVFILITALEKLFPCKILSTASSIDGSSIKVEVVSDKTTAEVVEYTFAFLRKALVMLWAQHQRESFSSGMEKEGWEKVGIMFHRGPVRVIPHRASRKITFLEGAAYRVYLKAKESLVRSVNDCTDLLVIQEEEINRYIDKNFENVREYCPEEDEGNQDNLDRSIGFEAAGKVELRKGLDR